MEFTGQYLTYEEYKSLGGNLDQTPFNLLEFEARKIIDGNTQNRLINVSEIPQEVKLCIFKLINSILKFSKEEDNSQNSNIASENIDGYSVTYNNVSLDQIENVVKSKNIELNDIVYDYLLGVVVNNVHLLYRGVR